MLEITRELVEHYLRATRWTMAFGSPYVYSHPEIRHELVLFGDYPQAWLPAIAQALSRDRSIVGFRLGLCAAAEQDFADADNLAMQLGSMGMFTTGDEHGACVLRAAANRRLLDAGISADAWESARKR